MTAAPRTSPLTVGAVRARLPGVRIEVLTPDFKGDEQALRAVLAAAPDVFNHNIEMAPRLFPRLRPQGDYGRSLELLRTLKRLRPVQTTKSGLMVGLGEDRRARCGAVLADLRAAQVDILTVGQYLRPTRQHAPVDRYVDPLGFAHLRGDGARARLPHCLLRRVRALVVQRGRGRPPPRARRA